jgi:DNA phosphorothioation-dependent restriction protein DptF
MTDMNFETLVETLSKGSATAVTTLESSVAELNVLEEYLYVQTPVEQALRTEIDRNLKTPRVIFVCGSSGDGKSDLFRRIHRKVSVDLTASWKILDNH